MSSSDIEPDGPSRWLDSLADGLQDDKQRLVLYCTHLLAILVQCGTSNGELAEQHVDRFWLLWDEIRQLSQTHAPPRSYHRKSGDDNYGYSYLVVARLDVQPGRFFERRQFLKLEEDGYYYCHGPDMYFYYNPEDGFYGSYFVKNQGDHGTATVTFQGVKASSRGTRSYTYPPDTPFRERDGLARRSLQ